jgi:hypothetical protein
MTAVKRGMASRNGRALTQKSELFSRLVNLDKERNYITNSSPKMVKATFIFPNHTHDALGGYHFTPLSDIQASQLP